MPLWATSPAAVETQTPFLLGPIKPDPTRNLVYVVDATYNRLLEINTDTGAQVAAASIDDGVTNGEIAISVDGTKLYLAESTEDEIMVFSLPNLTPLPTIPVEFAPSSIASCVGGRLFAAESVEYESYVLVEIDPGTGNILSTFGQDQDFFGPLLRTNAAGTNLYAQDVGGEGQSPYVYSLANGGISPATNIPYYCDNLEDYEPDEPEGRLYMMNGGIYGVNVLIIADDNYSTVWPFVGPYANAVSYAATGSVVFGASPYEIREFSRTNGKPLADWTVTGADDLNEVPAKGIATTSNGNCVYIREEDTFFSPTFAYLGLISPNGTSIVLAPTLTQTITFPSVGTTGVAGDSVTLQATDSSGLPITFTVISGPATISGNTLTYTGTGTVVIAAQQAGNALYASAQARQTITVSRGSQTISAFTIIPEQAFGTPSFFITPPLASSGQAVTVTVKSGPATITNNVITLTGVGAVTLAANQAGNASYLAAAEVTTSFVVEKGSQTISTFVAIPTQEAGGAPFHITLPTASSGLPVSVTVQTGPATLNGNTVTVTGPGTVVLAADQSGNSDYLAAAEVTTRFIVNGTGQKIMAFPPIASRTYSPAPFSITAPQATSGLPVVVTVLSGPATITNDGVITLTGAGTVVLAANQPGNAAFDAAPQVTTSFVVKIASQTLSPFAAIPVQVVGEPAFNVAAPIASSGLPVTVSILSGPALLNGTSITPTGSGTVTVVANQGGNAGYAAAPEVKTTFTVKLGQNIPAFNVANQTFGEAPFAISAVTSNVGLPVTFSILSGPATISRGRVALTGAGTVVLAANQSGNNTYVPASQATTSFAVDPEAQTIAAFRPIPATTYHTTPFAVAAPVATSKLPVTLSVRSGPATLAGGEVTLTGVGTVVLAADQAGNANYAAAPEVTTSFAVDPAEQTIGKFGRIPAKTTSSAPFAVIPPVASSKLPVTLSIKSGPATISGSIVTITGAGTVVLAADQAGDADYTTAPEVTASFVVR